MNSKTLDNKVKDLTDEEIMELQREKLFWLRSAICLLALIATVCIVYMMSQTPYQAPF